MSKFCVRITNREVIDESAKTVMVYREGAGISLSSIRSNIRSESSISPTAYGAALSGASSTMYADNC